MLNIRIVKLVKNVKAFLKTLFFFLLSLFNTFLLLLLHFLQNNIII